MPRLALLRLAAVAGLAAAAITGCANTTFGDAAGTSSSTAPSLPTSTNVAAAPQQASASTSSTEPRLPLRSSTTSTDATLRTKPPPATTQVPNVYRATVLPIGIDLQRRMPHSWRKDCPVGLEDLRLLVLTHWNFEGRPVVGELVVLSEVATDLVDLFRTLFDAGYPIERMELVDEYGADDRQSMQANNTSAFNCRFVAGTTEWSQHAYGRAIDINPLINPYVQGNHVSPPEGAAYVDRDPTVPGLITEEGVVVDAFESIGWEWGGFWSSSKDYQHFSTAGT